MHVPRFFLLLLAMGFSMPLAWSGTAFAQSESAQARQLMHDGNEHFAARRYPEAEKAFREAYVLSGRPGFLWNMAQCARLAGDSQRALSLYRRYVRDDPDGSQRAEAQRWIVVIETPKGPIARPEPESASPQPKLDRDSAPRSIPILPPSDQDEPGTTSGPIYEKWWFWAGAGAVVTGIVATVAYSSSGSGSSSEAPTRAGTIYW